MSDDIISFWTPTDITDTHASLVTKQGQTNTVWLDEWDMRKLKWI